MFLSHIGTRKCSKFVVKCKKPWFYVVLEGISGQIQVVPWQTNKILYIQIPSLSWGYYSRSVPAFQYIAKHDLTCGFQIRRHYAPVSFRATASQYRCGSNPFVCFMGQQTKLFYAVTSKICSPAVMCIALLSGRRMSASVLQGMQIRNRTPVSVLSQPLSTLP